MILPERHELLAAAWLHDVVEDCGVEVRELDKLFGHRVAMLVWEASHCETPPGMPRRDRWKAYLEHYASASRDGQILKLADRCCNLHEYAAFWDALPVKERVFVRGIYRTETMELVNRIGDADKDTAVRIVSIIKILETLP